MTDEMPRNSESQMIKSCVKWIKCNCPNIKILFTWADGMMGKPGYVYQASSFIYASYSPGEMYLQNGVKIHVRAIKKLICDDYSKESRVTVRPTLLQMNELGIKHYKGKQFRYFKFLCNKAEKNRLLKECQAPLNEPYPKVKDLSWKVKNEVGEWVDCDLPPYTTDVLN